MNVARPLDTARLLAGIYGQDLSASPLTYPHGVALSGRLRLAVIDGTSPSTAEQIARLVEPVVAAPDTVPNAGPSLSVACFADELFAITGDPRHRDFLIALADRYLGEVGFDPDVRVEDFFFAGTLLGRAFALTGDSRYADAVMGYLARVDTMQANGLYWHCHGSPYFWGRGNAFAALGLAEALSYVPEHCQREALIERNLSHLRALARVQHESGMWHQVVDDPSTYLEHSATCVIGHAIARGLARGWLPASEFEQVLERAWAGTVARIGSGGELEHVCVSTGPLGSLDDYVNRDYSDGVDARGGGFTLWFALEMLSVRS